MTVKMQAPDWTFSVADIERVITHRTKAIIVNSPGNPSGKVFSRQELESIAAIAQQYDLFVFTDEIYEYFLYDGRTHVSFATLPGMATGRLPSAVTPKHLVSPAGASATVSQRRGGHRRSEL